jgi:hypothetical protein
MGTQRKRRGSKEHALSAQQDVAIDLMIAGFTDDEIAKQLKVSRQTVWNWRNRDPHFQAEKKRRTADSFEPMRFRLVTVLIKAIRLMERAIDAGDVEAAQVMMRQAGQALDRFFALEFDELRQQNARLRAELDVIVQSVKDMLPREHWQELQNRLATTAFSGSDGVDQHAKGVS